MGDIRDIRDRIADYIYSLPDGTEISIMEAFEHLYGSEEYSWIFKDVKDGKVYSADGGTTFIVRNSDLWMILAYVRDEAEENDKVIDMSSWDNLTIKLINVLRFVVRDR